MNEKEQKSVLTEDVFLHRNTLLEEFDEFSVKNIQSLRNEEKKNPNEQESEYFTVKFKYTMSMRQRSLLLETLLNSIIRKKIFALNLAEYMIIEFLIESLIELPEYVIRSKNFEKIKENIEKLLNLSMTFLENLPLNTKNGEQYERPKEISEDIIQTMDELGFLMTEREYGSRIETYYPAKLIEFTVEVPLQSSKRGIPYSSYTKGYGESHRKKTSTPVDWEIDGEDIFGEKDFGTVFTPRSLPIPRNKS